MTGGNVSAIATYLTPSGKRRIFRCHTCETQFSETRETVFCDLRTTEAKVMMALKMLLVRVDLAGLSFVLGVTAETVLAWLRRAAHQAEAINRPLVRNLPVTQVPLDEMWNFIARKPARETDEAGASGPDGEDGRQWIWVSLAPEFRLMIAAVVGPRTLDMLCLNDSIRHDAPSVQRLLRAVEEAHALPTLVLAAWQVARALTVHLVEAVLAERARRPTAWPPCPACGMTAAAMRRFS